jgi:hypothetical protein
MPSAGTQLKARGNRQLCTDAWKATTARAESPRREMTPFTAQLAGLAALAFLWR